MGKISNVNAEKQLLHEIARGSEEAFRQFYEKFLLYVTNAVNKYCMEGTMAPEDHVQEVFLAVWRYRTNLVRVENIHYYLFAIAKNKVLQFQRVAVRNRNANLDEMNYKFLNHDPYVAVNYDRMFRIFCHTVKALPPRQKRAFLLSYEAGLSGMEVGKRMGITHFTVKNLNRVARTKLKKAVLAGMD